MLCQLAACCLLALPTVAAQDVDGVPPSPLELRVSPILDLWFEVRARAEEEGEGEPAADDPWRAAVGAARAATEALGHPLAFGLIEGRLAGCTTGRELSDALATLPEEFSLRRPGAPARVLALRKIATSLGHEVAELEEGWLREHWPERARQLANAATTLRDAFANGRDAKLLEHARGLLRQAPTASPVPVHLVWRAPAPGGFTHRTLAGGVCFVAVAERGRSELVEVLLHEALHATDVAPANRGALPAMMSTALRSLAGTPQEAQGPPAIHALFFLAAAEAVRFGLDPAHVDYGDAHGAYGRMGEAVKVVRPAWRCYLAGEIDAAEFVARVARELST